MTFNSSTTLQSNFYPGMVDNHYELFHHQDELKVLNSGNVFNFDQLPQSILNHIECLLENEEETLDFLENNDLPVAASSNTEVFAYCRFGGLDFTPDIDISCVDGNQGVIKIQDGEFWDCPMSDTCAGRGIVCKMPLFNGERLTAQEVDVMKLLKTNLTNEAIAYELAIPLGSYHLIKKNLYKKLGNLQTRHEVTAIASSLNIH
ncbi:hypothetical protein [Nonlabens dokdonensis]|uniref:LuxR C-terminal-related transcriptional regulator n=1 Tax=Nonlabens dokdonensis TaxID=328515 RepID=UPI0026EA791E|nr:hypothetical protein [Nonlabens dokdonensis]